MFEEHYWRTRWYSVLKVADPSGVLKGWYGNIACPAKVIGDQLVARALELDLWVSAGGEAITRLDEEEFRSSGLLSQEPELAAKAIEAFAELESIVLSGGLVSLLSQAPNPSIERTLPGKPVSASHVKR